MDDRVSVIIPTFNRAPLLQRAVDSVLNQTHAGFELIVVDDGSSDGTAELLAGYPDARIRYLHQENRGPAAARNLGIRAARYDLIALLDSDDWFCPTKLALQVAAMQQAPDFLISHTEETWYRQGQLLNPKKKHRKKTGDIFAQSLKLCAVSPSTVMARVALFDQVGLFDESLPCCEDYDLWLRVSASFPFLLLDLPLTCKDGGRPDQLSTQYRIGMDRWRIQALQGLLARGQLRGGLAAAARRELVRKSRIYGNGCLKHGKLDEARHYLELAAENG